MSELPSIQGFFIYRGKAKQKKEQEEKSQEEKRQEEKEKEKEKEQGQEKKNRQGEIVGIVIITTNSDGKKVFTYLPINQDDLNTDTVKNALLRNLLRNNNYYNLDTYDYNNYFEAFMKHITGIEEFSSDDFFSFNDTHSG
jgi:hypothetical protein